jgi:hypothetical protein
MPEVNNIRFISAQQAREVYQNKTIKEESIKRMHHYGLTLHDDIKCFGRFNLQPKSTTLSNNGMTNIDLSVPDRPEVITNVRISMKRV